MTCQRMAVGTLLLWATAFAAQTSPSGKTLVPMLPRPSGSFAVGRIGFDWTDRSRSEVLSKDADAKRELMVYVWYPTEKGGKIGKPAPYLPAQPRSASCPIAHYREPMGSYGQRSCPANSHRTQ